MKEIWKDIPGYEGFYQASSLGRIRAVKRQFLKPSVSHNGYLFVALYKNGIKKSKRINRLIAETFISNPENKPLVNHKNGIKTDNRAENLEWVTDSENKIHSYRILKNPHPMLGRTGEKNPNSKPVLQMKSNVIINKFSGLADAERKTGISYQLISGCCRKKHKTAGGFSWKYAD